MKLLSRFYSKLASASPVLYSFHFVKVSATYHALVLVTWQQRNKKLPRFIYLMSTRIYDFIQNSRRMADISLFTSAHKLL